MESPVNGLSVVTENAVYCVQFKDPQYSEDFVFPAAKLKGAEMPLRVLKPQDLDRNASKNWRPTIGMVPSTNRATMAPAGRRMLDHHQPRTPGSYSNVPPPSLLNSAPQRSMGKCFLNLSL